MSSVYYNSSIRRREIGTQKSRLTQEQVRGKDMYLISRGFRPNLAAKKKLGQTIQLTNSCCVLVITRLLITIHLLTNK